MTKHDYQKARFEFEKEYEELCAINEMRISDEAVEAIRHALKLAAIVTGEPSEGMLKATSCGWHYKDVFKAMIAQAQKEIDENGNCVEIAICDGEG